YCGYCYIKNSAQSIAYSSVRVNGECTGYVGEFIVFMYHCGTATKKVIAKITHYASREMERASNCYGNDDDCCRHIKRHCFLPSVYPFNFSGICTRNSNYWGTYIYDLSHSISCIVETSI